MQKINPQKRPDIPFQQRPGTVSRQSRLGLWSQQKRSGDWRQPSQAGDLFTVGQRITTLTQDNQYRTVIPSDYCLTNFLLDQCSTGPAIPGGGSPPVQGLPDYEYPARLAGALSPGRSWHLHRIRLRA